MSSRATARLLTEAVNRLRPHLSDDVDIEVTPHPRWTTLQRTGAIHDEHAGPPRSSISGVTIRSLRPWVPFLPRDLRPRLTAQTAVETVLGTAYEEPVDFEVKAVRGRDGIVVSFQPPRSRTRIELPAIPFDLL